jgi:hypothetical protein
MTSVLAVLAGFTSHRHYGEDVEAVLLALPVALCQLRPDWLNLAVLFVLADSPEFFGLACGMQTLAAEIGDA